MPCFFHQWNPENEKVPHSATAALDLQMGIDLRVTQLSLQASTCRPQNLHNLPAAPWYGGEGSEKISISEGQT